MKGKQFLGVLVVAVLVGGCLGGGAIGVRALLSDKGTASQNQTQPTATRTPTTQPTATASVTTTSATTTTTANSASGVVQSVTDSLVVLETADGSLLSVTVSSSTLILKTVPASLADMVAGVSISYTGSQQSDGSILATNITINQISAMPTQLPTQTRPAMTNLPTMQPGATFTGFPPFTQPAATSVGGMSGTIQSVDGNTISLNTQAGAAVQLVVSATTTMQKVSDGSLADITAGNTLTVNGTPQADGSILASNITVAAGAN